MPAQSRSRTPNLSGVTTSNSAPVNIYNLSLNASWAPDLWGGVRRTIEASVASAQASAATVAGARLLAQSQLAINFFQLRALDSQRQLLETTVAAYQRSFDLTRNRYNAGVAARVEVVLAEQQLRSTQAQLIDVGVQRAQLEHAIAILIGKPPADFALPPAKLATCDPGSYRSGCRRSCSSGAPTSRRPSGRWPPPTRRSASRRRLFFRH